jgi:hypothetical protein
MFCAQPPVHTRYLQLLSFKGTVREMDPAEIRLIRQILMEERERRGDFLEKSAHPHPVRAL